MKERFEITEYEHVVDYDAADSNLLNETCRRGDLSEAISAWNGDCWDNEDWRDNKVILYPADWHRDFRTGEVTYTDVVIEGNPRHIHWLYKMIHGLEPLPERKSVWRRMYGYFRRNQ